MDLLAVQGTLKSLQYHSSKASILQCSAFFTEGHEKQKMIEELFQMKGDKDMMTKCGSRILKMDSGSENYFAFATKDASGTIGKI